MELMNVSRQWASRPTDERFVNLHELGAMVGYQRQRSNEKVVSSRQLTAMPVPGDFKALRIAGPQGNEMDITNYAFGQLAARADSPAGYLRKLASPVAADCLNYGLRFLREIEDIGVLLTRYEEPSEGKPLAQIRAVTGPKYGRIWNSEIVNALISEFGNGVDGTFRIPGEFGKPVSVTKENTTLYASDRDMFVFLCDEVNRVEMHNRRDGKEGSLARGFYIWNSEVGDNTFGLASFLFDYACCNRIIWGATEFRQIKFRHTVSAPDKWLHQVAPILSEYSKGSVKGVEETIKAAQAAKIDRDLEEFMTKRFGLNAKQAGLIMQTHELEEKRPIETIWDLTTGITAFAKSIPFQNERVEMEKIGGRVLDLVKVGSTNQDLVEMFMN